jgi:hypothetical protein
MIYLGSVGMGMGWERDGSGEGGERTVRTLLI